MVANSNLEEAEVDVRRYFGGDNDVATGIRKVYQGRGRRVGRGI